MRWARNVSEKGRSVGEMAPGDSKEDAGPLHRANEQQGSEGDDDVLRSCRIEGGEANGYPEPGGHGRNGGGGEVVGGVTSRSCHRRFWA